jgi:trimethylamine--corrinoid protein Co-methyltransferase
VIPVKEVDIIGVLYSPQDVPSKTALLYSIKNIIERSKKPIFYSCESRIINEAVIKMVKAVLGKKTLGEGSNMVSQLSTTSQLYWKRGKVEALYICSKEGVPLDFLPQPITGVTAPYTLAGILALHNAEVLSGIVISQLINPGLPLVYGAAWTTYEMKLTNVLTGRPESSLLRIAGAQMAHYYNMPSHTTAPDNDSNLYDEQGAWEKILSTLAGIVGTNDLIVNMGMFGTSMSISLEPLVMDNEICRIIKRFHKGFEVDEKTIAFDTIRSAGIRGVYLMEDNTLENLRSMEHDELDVSNGANYYMWLNRDA